MSVCVLDKVIILSKFVTEKERIHTLALQTKFHVCYFDSLSENENLTV